MIVLDIIEHCNFKCHFCKAKDIDTPQFMPLELFKSIILQAKELGETEIDLIPAKGDPFLHPDIYEMLAFLNEHMKYTIVFTNVTGVNIRKLREIQTNNIKLCVSYYGETPERFAELTGMGIDMFNKVHRKLKMLDKSGIRYNLERRDYGYVFSYPGMDKSEDLDSKVKCHFHTMPKILANGDVMFCKFVKDNTPPNEKLAFANLNVMSLKDALEHPLRYKFFDSQSICIKHCSSFSRSCYKESVIGFKHIVSSKRAYANRKEETDKQYREIENAIVQRTQS